jgi:hypothetical protein
MVDVVGEIWVEITERVVGQRGQVDHGVKAREVVRYEFPDVPV